MTGRTSAARDVHGKLGAAAAAIGTAGVVLGFLAGLAVGANRAATAAISTGSGAPFVSLLPTDFAVLPCPGQAAGAPCAIIAAGGKRLLVGAPAGIGPGRAAGETGLPDVVLLPALGSGMIEGLDEVRNRTWAEGRRTPLLVVGMAGTSSIVDGLNDAYVQSDALAYLDKASSIGFDAAPLAALEVGPGDTAFDTGDLRVIALDAGPDALGLEVSYGGAVLRLFTCGALAQRMPPQEPDTVVIACDGMAGSQGAAAVWPLAAPVNLGNRDGR